MSLDAVGNPKVTSLESFYIIFCSFNSDCRLESVLPFFDVSFIYHISYHSFAQHKCTIK